MGVYVVLHLCQTHTYCDVLRIKNVRHIRCCRHPVWVSCTRVQRDDDKKKRWERVWIYHNYLKIYNPTLLSHLTSSQRDNCHHNGPPQGGLHVEGIYQRRLSKPQGLCRLKREAEGIAVRTAQEEESWCRITTKKGDPRHKKLRVGLPMSTLCPTALQKHASAVSRHEAILVHPAVIECPSMMMLVIKRLLLGYIKSHSCFINNPAHIKRLRSKLSLAKSLEAVKEIEDDEATKKHL